MKLIPPLPLPPLGAPPPIGLWNSEMLWRYSSAPPSPFSSDIKNQMPPQLSTDPRLWNRDDVSVFLRWCEREFDLPKFEMELFQMNGKALCLLTKNDLAERIPGAGDLLHNVVQILVRESQFHRHLPSSPVTPTSRYPLSPHSHPPTPNWSALVPPDSPFHPTHLQHFMTSNSVTLSPAPSIDSQASSPPRQHEQVQTVFPKTEMTSSSSNQSDSDEESYTDAANKLQQSSTQSSPPLTPISKEVKNLPQQITNMVNSWGSQSDKSSPATPLTPGAFMPVKREFFPDTPEPNTNGRLLWDFLQQLLNDTNQRYSNYIAWKCRDTGVFKIVDPPGLAKLWGIQKNHLSMNYDKMSRALRYYYRVNILRKVQGERHCYQFLRNPSELKNIKNISLLRQSTPASPSAINNSNNNTQSTQSQQQQQHTVGQQNHHHQQPHQSHEPPPNSPMMMLTNSIHHHHISGGLSSPAVVSQQQFQFPPQPQYQHQNTGNGRKESFLIEPKLEIVDDMMPTDLSVSSDRRYINNTTEAFPLIRNSNGLTTITLVQPHSPNHTTSNQNEPVPNNNESKSSNIDEEMVMPTDLRKQE